MSENKGELHADTKRNTTSTRIINSPITKQTFRTEGKKQNKQQYCRFVLRNITVSTITFIQIFHIRDHFRSQNKMTKICLVLGTARCSTCITSVTSTWECPCDTELTEESLHGFLDFISEAIMMSDIFPSFHTGSCLQFVPAFDVHLLAHHTQALMDKPSTCQNMSKEISRSGGSGDYMI